MNASRRVGRWLVLAFLLAGAMPAKAQTDAAGLVDALTTQLGVTEEQATGGSGAIFELARQQLAPAQYSELSEAVPGIESLMAAAPALGEGGGGSGLLGDAASALGALGGGGGLGDLAGLAQLAGPFSQLGMSPDMVGQFVPIVLDYVQSGGGTDAMRLLQTVLAGG